MNVYRITLQQPYGEHTKYHITFRKATSGKQLKKKILRKIEPTSWTLKNFRYSHEAKQIPPPRRKMK